MNRTNRKKIDQLGIITSGLCAVHCAVLPILLSLGIIGGLSSVGHGTFEWSIIAISAVLGLWSIYNGLSGHGKIIPQLMIGFGALIIILGLIIPFIGHGIMAVGGVALLFGHWLNWRQMSFRNELIQE